jgi:peptide/nickel transport system substrate-binding protein
MNATRRGRADRFQVSNVLLFAKCHRRPRDVPCSSARDVDLSFGIPDKDAKELVGKPGLNVAATPIENCIYCLGVNLKFDPFKDKKVRQAIAYAVPYEEIFKAAAFGNGVKMWGGRRAVRPTSLGRNPFPTPRSRQGEGPARRDPIKDGFEVPLAINQSLASWMEPTALLIQESLGKIGIKATIDKIPGANWRTAALVEKRLPLHLENFGGWLNYPDYYFFWAYIKGHLFNSSNYDNPEVKRSSTRRCTWRRQIPNYAPKIKRLIEIAFEDVPRIPLWQPTLNSGMTDALKGYEFWFHRQLDARKFTKA